MATVDMLVVISYDVSDNKRRRGLARFLEKRMTRVQQSVFEGRFDAGQTRAIVKDIENMVQPGDSLRIYSIGADGLMRSTVLGTTVPMQEDADYWLA